MKVSLNTVKQYTTIDISVDELVAKINEQLGSVENVIDIAKCYAGATIVKVVECVDHPNADKLHVCKVDDGGVTRDVERDENAFVQVVCGAPNVHADMFAVWLPPKSTVPASFSDKEPFVLEARELRGVVSNGMLASLKELGIGESHDGILEIDPNEWKPGSEEIKPGANFAKVYGLDDTTIEIENKMFTHRPDLFGQIGVAREIAGIQHKPFSSPDWYKTVREFGGGEGLELKVTNEAGGKVSRFMAVAIKNIEVKPSPLWLQCELVRLGSKPINNIVDVTNYVMLLTAQPLHAYDYDKLRGHALGARAATKGEKAPLLNGKSYELTEDDVVIFDGDGPVGLGGVMGGGNSEVSSDTKNIVLECASFDMYMVRKTSMRHGLFTEAVTRFNKGQSSLQNPYSLSLAMQSVLDVAGGEQASQVFDSNPAIMTTDPVKVDVDFINARLGLKLTSAEVIELLENVEISVELPTEQNSYLEITPPFWRTDIELPEDVVEEVGRLYGFDKLPRELPRRSIKPAAKNQNRERAQYIRKILASAGANEVLTYSFIHENIMKKAGQDPTHAYRLTNALSPDLQYYRLSLTPSLLDKIHMNAKAGFDHFALFELNKVHYKGEMDKAEPNIPNEDSHLGFVIAYDDKQKPAGSAFYYARKYLNQIVDLDVVQLTPLIDFDLTKDEWGRQLTAMYEPLRAAVIMKDDQIWGVVGEYKQSVKRAFKLPDFVAGFELHQDIIKTTQAAYVPLSKYPSSQRDISFQVKWDVAYQDVISALRNQTNDAVTVKITPLDIYQPETGDMKNVTVRLTITSNEKTLNGEEVSKITDQLANGVVDACGATII